jgi:hypothetical protein
MSASEPASQDEKQAANQDIPKMDDPALIIERRRVREALERTPPDEIGPELRQRWRLLDDEFDRRARTAWQQVS